MRLGAQAVELAEGTRAREAYGEARRPRAPPPPLRGEQPLPAAARGGRAGRLGHVPGGAPGRDHRAARPPVVRRQPVPPGVQVAPDPAGAALPRLRRRRATRARARGGRAPADRTRSRRSAGCSALDARMPVPCRARTRPDRRRASSSSSSRDAEPVRAGAGRGRRASRATCATRLDVDEDDAGARGSARRWGTSTRRIEPTAQNGGTPIFLCAHLDTVPPEAPIEPVVARRASSATRGRRSSAPTTSRRSRSMLEAVRRIVAEGRPHAGIELVFTPKEEVGLRGRRRVRRRRGSSPGRVTCTTRPSPIGDVILGAPHQASIECVFRGKAAHAGMHPEEGRSAIAAAARAIADLRLGRLDEMTTASVGLIRGGTAQNVVPELCSFAATCARTTRGARRPGPGDARDVHLRRDPRRLRRGDAASRSTSRATASASPTRPCASPSRRCSAPATSRTTC